jgi:hypothetical protein
MYDVALPVTRHFILNSVWLTYAVVRFVVRRLMSLYNYCQCLVVRSVARRVVCFLFQFKCCVTCLAARQFPLIHLYLLIMIKHGT